MKNDEIVVKHRRYIYLLVFFDGRIEDKLGCKVCGTTSGKRYTIVMEALQTVNDMIELGDCPIFCPNCERMIAKNTLQKQWMAYWEFEVMHAPALQSDGSS